MYPAALIGKGHDGKTMIKLPLLTIISIGHTGKSFVYVTVEPHTMEKMRFWIHAFSCKTADHAATTAAKMIQACSVARKEFQAAKKSGETIRVGPDPNLSDANFLHGQEVEFSTIMEPSDASAINESLGPIDLSRCLREAEHTLDESTIDSIAELDLNLSTTALAEMYDLDCALQEYGIAGSVRGRLLEAWQSGFSTAAAPLVPTPKKATAAQARVLTDAPAPVAAVAKTSEAAPTTKATVVLASPQPLRPTQAVAAPLPASNMMISV